MVATATQNHSIEEWLRILSGTLCSSDSMRGESAKLGKEGAWVATTTLNHRIEERAAYFEWHPL